MKTYYIPTHKHSLDKVATICLNILILLKILFSHFKLAAREYNVRCVSYVMSQKWITCVGIKGVWPGQMKSTKMAVDSNL